MTTHDLSSALLEAHTHRGKWWEKREYRQAIEALVAAVQGGRVEIDDFWETIHVDAQIVLSISSLVPFAFLFVRYAHLLPLLEQQSITTALVSRWDKEEFSIREEVIREVFADYWGYWGEEWDPLDVNRISANDIMCCTS